MKSTATSSQHVVIVGGSAAGMSCATRLRRLDESVRITVIERGPFISYANCGLPYALSGVISNEADLILQTPETMLAWFNVDVIVNTALVSIDRQKSSIKVTDMTRRQEQGEDEYQSIGYDKLVLALGADPHRPAIPGIDRDHVFTLQNIPDLRGIKAHITAHQCRQVAVLGGGFIGLEVAENLCKAGMAVTILEWTDHVLPLLDRDMVAAVQETLSSKGIRLKLKARIKHILPEVSGQMAQIVLCSGESVPADLVVVSTGTKPRTEIADRADLLVGETGILVADSMQTSDLNIYAVGDLVETRTVVTDSLTRGGLAGPANRQGRIAADHICGLNSEYRGTLGTTILRVFDLAVGITGASMEMIRRNCQRMDVKYVIVHPMNHAAYYPGAMRLKIKVVFESNSGKLLGAQVHGREGVDKRLDVLAMALMSGMSIEDLEHVELSYAPPYGSAKDPVNMAGFVGGNSFRGTTTVINVEDLLVDLETDCDALYQNGDHDFSSVLEQKYQIVDVRTAAEFEAGHLIGAVNIPLNRLRASIELLDKSQSILVYCWVGYRGYIAERILRQIGFSVFNLNGGLLAVTSGGYGKLLAPTPLCYPTKIQHESEPRLVR